MRLIGTHRSQSPADSTGLLLTKVQGNVLLALVEFAEMLPLLRVCDGQYPSNRLAHGVTGMQEYQNNQSVEELMAHIFVNFDAEPPAIFCTRSDSNSSLSSLSCFDKSFFDL